MQGVLVTPQSALLYCRAGGAGRRRHQRRRDWSSDAQQQRGGGAGGVTFDLQSAVKGARQAMLRVEAHCARIAESRGLVLPFRPLGALGFCALSLLFLVAAVRALVSKYQRGERQRILVRRDRSLGGKEVVVATQHAGGKSSSRATASRVVPAANFRRRRNEGLRLPQWWRKQDVEQWGRPQDVHARQQAEALVRGMMEKRLHGLDFTEEDICELRELCKHSGVKVRFATENARDAFFRAATNALLSACMGSRSNHFVYCGENAASFLSGLAANIQLEEERAASIVNAAVASRTRAGFLQAWASVLRGNVLEADGEIKGLVCMHCVFPAHEDSPEMEMVGHGLRSHLTPEERNELFKMYKRYGDSTLSIAMEALALDGLG